MTSWFKRAPALLLPALLVACGGGGDDSSTGLTLAPDPLAQGAGSGVTDPDPTSTVVPVVFVTVDPATGAISTSTGTFDKSTNTLTGAGLTGTTDADLSVFTPSSSTGIVLSAPDGETSSRIFSQLTTGAGSTPIGVVGFPTDPGDLTALTTATYSGTSAVSIVDGTDVYDLRGDADLSVDFTGGLVDWALSNLDGTRTASGSGTPTIVADVTLIDVDDAAITGSGFSGGTITVSDFSTGGAATDHEGQFFGDDAAEAGGAIEVDGAALEIIGIYIAAKD